MLVMIQLFLCRLIWSVSLLDLISIVFFFERQIWITDGPLEYYRSTSGTTRSYPSPLGIIPIHQFKRKPNKYGKNPPCGIRTRDQLIQKSYLIPKMSLGYKVMRKIWLGKD
ncbi:hypothetical protein Hanom_Chr00s003057g01708381 [Helianthus anomalus]